MEFHDVVGRRRMCRRFLDQALEPSTLDRLLALAARAPSAGNTQGWEWLVLEGPEQTGRFWALDAEEDWLADPDHPGLLQAPVLVIPLASRPAYEHRYAEADKTGGALDEPSVAPGGDDPIDRSGNPLRTGRGPSAWAVPYWLIDTAFATMVLLLAATEEGLGVSFSALHRPPAATLTAFGVPEGLEALGTVALGWPDPADRPGSSASRPRRTLASQVHRGHW